jgi:hypothetical protein
MARACGHGVRVPCVQVAFGTLVQLMLEGDEAEFSRVLVFNMVRAFLGFDVITSEALLSFIATLLVAAKHSMLRQQMELQPFRVLPAAASVPCALDGLCDDSTLCVQHTLYNMWA